MLGTYFKSKIFFLISIVPQHTPKVLTYEKIKSQV